MMYRIFAVLIYRVRDYSWTVLDKRKKADIFDMLAECICIIFFAENTFVSARTSFVSGT